MTDEVVVQDELAALKQQADVMGIDYPKTVTKTALKKLIAEKLSALKMPVILMQLSKNLKLKTSDWCV